jgi:glyoxylase-like metal-dependent hydrolase (beta-lactamase superfamily II)
MSHHSLGQSEGLQKLTDNAYAFIGSDGGPNHGLLVTEKGGVVVDNDIRSIDRFMDAIRKTTPQEIRFLINTHHAFDHTSANHVFAEQGAVIISSVRAREHLDEMGEKKIAQMGTRDENLRELTRGLKVTLPDITFDHHLSIHLGSQLLELIFVGHCHSVGDAIVYLPKEKIVFAGDLLLSINHPNTRDGNRENWIQALDLIYGLPVEIIVPGHGGIIHGKKECLVMKEYFLTVKSKVEDEVKKGKELEDIKREFSLPEYGDWGKEKWLWITIEKIYRECLSSA